MIKDTFALSVLHLDSDGLGSPVTYTIESTGSQWLYNGEPLAFRRFAVLAGWGKLDGPAMVLGVKGLPWEIALPVGA